MNENGKVQPPDRGGVRRDYDSNRLRCPLFRTALLGIISILVGLALMGPAMAQRSLDPPATQDASPETDTGPAAKLEQDQTEQLPILSPASPPVVEGEAASESFRFEEETKPEPIGAGDGRIHVIPSLSATSIKNGQKLTISAVIKSVAAVARVEAEIEDIVTIELSPASSTLGGVRPDGKLGLWRAEWEGRDLEERFYTVTIRVTDVTGHTFEDASLSFSDPIAGINVAGTTAYPNAALNRIGADIFPNEIFLNSAVIDAAAGFAYFGTETVPPTVVKVALGSGPDPPTRIGSVGLGSAADQNSAAVIDVAGGHAYFVTRGNPGSVVKVALGAGANPPVRVGAVTLAAGEINPECAAIDPAGGHLYLGTSTTPGIVVKVALGAGSNPPTRVGAVTLNTGENLLASAVIDAAAGHAYFGTRGSGIVVKVALGAGPNPPVRLGAVSLDTGESFLISAVIDVAGGHAYFASLEGNVVKVALGAGSNPPTRVGAVALGAGSDLPLSGVIDAAGGHAYFGTLTTNPGIVFKVALGAGSSPPALVGALALGAGELRLFASAIDPAGGHAYFGTNTFPGRVVRVALGAGSNPPTRVGAVTLTSAEGSLATSAVIDPPGGHAYFGTGTSPGIVVKAALGAGSKPPMRVGAVALNPGEDNVGSAVIDLGSGHAYFGTATDPGIVVKVALGVGSNPPTRIGAVTLNAGESNLESAVIDPAGGYAYFGTRTNPGIVVKVALGAGSNPPTRIGAVTLNPGEVNLRSGAIDVAGGHAYFGTSDFPAGRVVKVALGAGSNAPTRVGAVTLDAGERSLVSAIIDGAGGHAYFGTSSDPGIVVKVALGAGSNPPTRVGAVMMAPGENRLHSAAIDVAGGHAYFGTSLGNPGRVIKVALGAGSNPPVRVGALVLDPDESQLRGAAIDLAGGHAYFAALTDPGRIIKVSYSQVGFVKASKVNVPQWADVTDIDFYSHAALGNARLAIYDNAEPKNLVWQSDSVVNSAAGAFLSVPIASGAPSALTIPPGTYWLAWQVDSGADVPSFTAGAPGDGFSFSQVFGAYPSSLPAATINSTSETWSEFIAFAASPPEIEVSPAGPIVFGDQDVGAGATVAAAVTITNIGTGALNFTGPQVALTGADATEFAIVGDTGEASLDPSDSRTVSVAFDPTTVGGKSANLTITSDDADEMTLNVTLSGVGAAAPEIEMADGATAIPDGGGPIDFGVAVQGDPPPIKTFTVSNTGSLTLTTSSLDLPSGYSVTEPLALSIAPGASDSFTVALSTAAPGAIGGTIRFSNNDADENPFDFTVTGTILGFPEVGVLSGTILLRDGAGPFNMGTALLGGPALERTFKVVNTGARDLTTSNLTVPAGYTVVDPLDATIPQGLSDEFTIRLATGTLGVFAGTISFDNSDADENPYNFLITGAVAETIPMVPTLSQWGIFIMALLLLVAGRRLAGGSGSIRI